MSDQSNKISASPKVRKFARGGALMGQMRARDNRADMEAGGMVSRGGRMSRQGIKFKGVK